MRIDQPIPASLPPAARAVPANRPLAGDLRAGLSTEEVSYFADLEQLGPLTYGRRGTAATPHESPAAIGQRLDVRA